MTSERDAFLDACRAVGPTAVSACPGWTTREVAAHQAATCAEVGVSHLSSGTLRRVQHLLAGY